MTTGPAVELATHLPPTRAYHLGPDPMPLGGVDEVVVTAVPMGTPTRVVIGPGWVEVIPRCGRLVERAATLPRGEAIRVIHGVVTPTGLVVTDITHVPPQVLGWSLHHLTAWTTSPDRRRWCDEEELGMLCGNMGLTLATRVTTLSPTALPRSVVDATRWLTTLALPQDTARVVLRTTTRTAALDLADYEGEPPHG